MEAGVLLLNTSQRTLVPLQWNQEVEMGVAASDPLVRFSFLSLQPNALLI